jgi:hypothetical protein
MTKVSKVALESRARRAAKRVGLVVRKSRQAEGIDNLGGFMLVDAELGGCVQGSRFDMTPEDVIDYCKKMTPKL